VTFVMMTVFPRPRPFGPRKMPRMSILELCNQNWAISLIVLGFHSVFPRHRPPFAARHLPSALRSPRLLSPHNRR
jgi:hypothetical protein